jgi:cell division septation protein DedD
MSLIICYVLAGPIAMSATEMANTGDLIELEQGDLDQLSRWGIVREATQEEIEASKPAPTEPEPPAPEVQEPAPSRSKSKPAPTEPEPPVT